jgi:hypothetical protein
MHRSEAHVAKRVKELSLHLQVSFSEDEDSDDELAVLPAKKPVTTVATRAVAGSDNFGGIIFSDQDGDSDGGLDLDPEAPLSPLAPVLSTRRGAAHATQGAVGDTQIDTQYDETQYTAYTAQSPTSPGTRPRTRPQAQTGSGSGTQASDFAGLFSPSDTSLNEDIEQEARLKDSSAAGTQLQGTFTDEATQSQNPFATQSQLPATQRSQPTVRKAKLREAAVATNLPVGRAAWDLDEHDTDILEQRALGLMRATGGASYGLSDGDDDEDAVTTAAYKNKPAKRGLKRPKPSARVGKAADSDGEDDLFAEETQSQHIEAATAPAQEKAAVSQNKRRAVIESDDE